MSPSHLQSSLLSSSEEGFRGQRKKERMKERLTEMPPLQDEDDESGMKRLPTPIPRSSPPSLQSLQFPLSSPHFNLLSPTSIYHQPQPKFPQSWTWTCHLCKQTWKIGTTQRCLNCGHRLCIGQQTNKEHEKQMKQRGSFLHSLRRKEMLESFNIRGAMAGGGGNRSQDLYPQQQERQRGLERRLMKPETPPKIVKRYCRTQFDFLGWGDWNQWRREAQLFNDDYLNMTDDDDDDTFSTPSSPSTADAEGDSKKTTTTKPVTTKKKDGADHKDESKNVPTQLPARVRSNILLENVPTLLPLPREKRLHSCWDDCDFPSQCFHEE